MAVRTEDDTTVNLGEDVFNRVTAIHHSGDAELLLVSLQVVKLEAARMALPAPITLTFVPFVLVEPPSEFPASPILPLS